VTVGDSRHQRRNTISLPGTTIMDSRNHTVVLENSEQIPTHEFVLRAGKSISGKAICTDGKPPVGWRISGLTDVVEFRTFSPRRDRSGGWNVHAQTRCAGKIQRHDSAFRWEKGSSASKPVLGDVELNETEGELALKINHPSPASLVYLKGHVKINGTAPRGGFWIEARSDDNQHSSSTFYREGAGDSFRIGPIPPGEYTLSVQSAGIKPDTCASGRRPTTSNWW